MKGDFGMCRGCKVGKSSEAAHRSKNHVYRAHEKVKLVHTDLAGPFKPRAIEGKSRYALVFVDDFSRKSWTIPLVTKNGVTQAMKDWILMKENQSGKRLKKLRSDNGGEFVNGELGAWLADRGVDHQKIPKESPQSNGIAKRMNRNLQDRARSMLIGARLGGGGEFA